MAPRPRRAASAPGLPPPPRPGFTPPPRPGRPPPPRPRPRGRRLAVLAGLLVGLLAAPGAGPRARADEPAAAAPGGEPAPPAGLREDVVHLDNGASFSGRVVRDDGEVVVLEQTSDTGGLARLTFPRAKVVRVDRGAGGERPGGGVRPVRDEWYLLRSAGRVVGVRRLQLWTVRDLGEPGFRLEETVDLFAQGTHLPAIRATRTEITDLRFCVRLVTWREQGEGRDAQGVRTRYERAVSGRVKDGVWYGAVLDGGTAAQVRREVPPGTRGRLGLREHLLRSGPSRLGLETASILDPALEGLVTVRAGFASAEDLGAGLEFHWEEDGQRRVSWFPAESGGPVREEVREGLVALGVSAEQAEAARQQALGAGADPARLRVEVPEVGLGWRLPDALWTWEPRLAAPTDTGWRVLGVGTQAAQLANLRVEWHPHEEGEARDAAAAEAWLLARLRGAAPDLEVREARRPLDGVEGAWRLKVRATLKDTPVETIVVVVDRPAGRVVLLLAIPVAGWADGREGLERLVSSLYTI